MVSLNSARTVFSPKTQQVFSPKAIGVLRRKTRMVRFNGGSFKQYSWRWQTVLGLDTPRCPKKRRRQTSWIFFPSVRERDFLFLTIGKAPLTVFSLRCGCCQIRWGSLRCLPPATSRNKWSKPVTGGRERETHRCLSHCWEKAAG